MSPGEGSMDTSGGRRAFSAGHRPPASRRGRVSSKRNLVKSFSVAGIAEGKQQGLLSPQRR